MDKNAKLTANIIESLHEIETIKSCNFQNKLYHSVKNKFNDMLKSVYKLFIISNNQSILKNILQFGGRIVILWIGGFFVIKGKLSIGELIAFEILTGYFLAPLRNVIDLQPQLQTAIVATERIGDILDLEHESNLGEKNSSIASSLGKICFQNVCFRYGTRQNVLENLNLDIDERSRVAIAGKNGRGKTTIAKLLLNLYQPESGKITISECDINDIDKSYLRTHIAYITQDTFLFNGTIIENLSLYENVSLDKIVEVAKLTNAHSFIDKLPLKYDTIMEENSSNFSGGQRQLLAITRAMLANPNILILDEATSSYKHEVA
jgi:ATP-binding cassette subfamily B protein